MGISVQKLCIGVLFLSAHCDGANDLVCTGNTKYRVKKGRASCRECPTCVGGGFGWNTTVKRVEDEHGFRSCFPCVKCTSGTYRQLDSIDPECQPCRLDCVWLNRYGSVPCGGDNPGHCGECKIGFKADSKEPNSMCTARTTKGPEKSTTDQPETELEPRSSVFRNDHSYIYEKGGSTQVSNLSVWIPAGILLLLILIAISLAVYGAGLHKDNRGKYPRSLAREVESSKALINSGSSLGEDNLEIDGDKKVRGERPEFITVDELEAIGSQFVEPSIPKEKVVKTCYDRVLEKDDDTLKVAAKGIHSEQRHELFQTYLKLEKSKTSPEEEKWHKGIVTFADYIMEVLKIWLQTADKAATLKALCNALQMASFDDVVSKILDLPENQNTAATDSDTEEEH